MIEGLQTGNAALVGAAAEQMHANSADVGGNNIPVTGGTYNADGLTVADVLSTAGAPAPAAVAAVAPAPAAAPTVAAAPTPAAAPAATLAATDAGTHDAAPTTVEIHHSKSRCVAPLPPHVGITRTSITFGVPSHP